MDKTVNNVLAEGAFKYAKDLMVLRRQADRATGYKQVQLNDAGFAMEESIIRRANMVMGTWELIMGYYIETGSRKGKAQYLKDNFGAVEVSKTEAFQRFQSHDIVVVVDNGLFEAAGFAFNLPELEAFTGASDQRFRVYLAMPLGVAAKLSGFTK